MTTTRLNHNAPPRGSHAKLGRRFFTLLLAMLTALANLPVSQAQVAPQRATINDEEQGNPSALLYTPRNGRAVTNIAEGDVPSTSTTTARGKMTIGDAVAHKHKKNEPHAPHWNSEAGRAAAAEQLSVHLDEAAPAPGEVQNIIFNGKDVCSLPDIVKADSGCCSYTYPDQLNGGNVVYRQPYHVFTTGNTTQRENDARDFAADVRASMPMFLPYKNSHVHAGHGWIYNNGGFHGAVDYGRDNAQQGVDAAFGVYAVAAGTVVSVFWDNWSGNIVIIEHTAPNGDRYRSTYMHLRDGFDHDLAAAQAIPAGAKFDADGNIRNTWKYNKFANKDNPDPLYWGTNAQTIQVEVGDTVTAGQFIGWSGNTGPGGAGNGLDANGNPTNAATANNHLHLMMTVPDPRPGFANDWVQVDPYGVYSEVDMGCYDLMDTAPYARLFAPFYPSFHNVPANVVSKYFGYYPGMGLALQTLNLHRDGNEVLASGSFQYGLPSQWYARFYMTAADFQHWFDEYHDKGYRPREISVTPDSNGNPRFNVIWKKRNGEGYYTFFGLTDAQWQQKWNDLVVDDSWVVEEQVTYDTNAGARHAAVFISAPKVSFAEWHYLSSATFNTKFAQLNGQGFRNTNMHVAELDGTRYYGGIWRKVPGAWITLYGLTPAEYQAQFNNYTAQGYRLYRIQGYADSSRFAAIWTK
jgi:murein DD-endopeptidase MepM/ murein hydrolase activator NlpD